MESLIKATPDVRTLLYKGHFAESQMHSLGTNQEIRPPLYKGQNSITVATIKGFYCSIQYILKYQEAPWHCKLRGVKIVSRQWYAYMATKGLKEQLHTVPMHRVEPLNKGHLGTSHFVLYREVVLLRKLKNALG